MLRGGYGMFYGFLGQRRGDVIQSGFSQTTTIVPTLNNGLTFIATLSNPFHERHQGAGRQRARRADVPRPEHHVLRSRTRSRRGCSAGRPACSASWRATGSRKPVYVGNYGYDIETTRNINALPNQYLNKDNSRTAEMVANNAFLAGVGGEPLRGAPAGDQLQQRRPSRAAADAPVSAFGDINTTNNDGKTWYNSAQISLQKRFTRNYTLGATYTWSHLEQATEYLNAADADPTRMISDLDVPHRLSINGI